jgi:hypothetical protein
MSELFNLRPGKSRALAYMCGASPDIHMSVCSSSRDDDDDDDDDNNNNNKQKQQN